MPSSNTRHMPDYLQHSFLLTTDLSQVFHRSTISFRPFLSPAPHLIIRQPQDNIVKMLRWKATNTSVLHLSGGVQEQAFVTASVNSWFPLQQNAHSQQANSEQASLILTYWSCNILNFTKAPDGNFLNKNSTLNEKKPKNNPHQKTQQTTKNFSQNLLLIILLSQVFLLST